MAVPNPEKVPVQISLVEGPSSWWVTGLVDSLSEFQNFVKKLSLSVKYSPSRSLKQFESGDLVVVKQPGPLSEFIWCRGRIRCVFESRAKPNYKVFLIDYGSTIRTTCSSDVQLCPSNFAKYPAQAKLIRLYGLLPATIDFDLTDERAPHRLTRGLDWTKRAVDFVKDLYIGIKGAYFVKNDVTPDDSQGVVVFGDLWIEINGRLISLSDELVNNRLAVFAPEDFLKEFLPSNDRPIIQSRDVSADCNIPTSVMAQEAKKRQRDRLEAYRRAAFGSQEDLESPTAEPQSDTKATSDEVPSKTPANFSNAVPTILSIFKAASAKKASSPAQRISSPTNSVPSPKTLTSQAPSEVGSSDRGTTTKVVMIPAGYIIENESRKKKRSSNFNDNDDWSSPSSSKAGSHLDASRTHHAEDAKTPEILESTSSLPSPNPPKKMIDDCDSSVSSRHTPSVRSTTGSGSGVTSTKTKHPLIDLLRKSKSSGNQASSNWSNRADSVSGESDAGSSNAYVQQGQSFASTRSSASENGEEPNSRMRLASQAVVSNTKTMSSTSVERSSEMEVAAVSPEVQNQEKRNSSGPRLIELLKRNLRTACRVAETSS